MASRFNVFLLLPSELKGGLVDFPTRRFDTALFVVAMKEYNNIERALRRVTIPDDLPPAPDICT